MSFALLLAKNVHLSIGEEFCAFPYQKLCTSVSPLLNGAEFTLSVAKNVALFETVRILRTVKWRGWQGIPDRSSKTNDRISGCTVLLSRRKNRKKWIKLIPKTIGNRKRDCAWGCAWGINTTWENLQIEKHKSGRRSFRSPTADLCFSICRFSQVVFIPQAQPHAQSLFLFPIVFGINIYTASEQTSHSTEVQRSLSWIKRCILCAEIRIQIWIRSWDSETLGFEKIGIRFTPSSYPVVTRKIRK